MFLNDKKEQYFRPSDSSYYASGCPCRGTALPCPDGCREAMPEAPKSHFLKGGLSACKRYPFGLQKTTFCEPKDGLLGKPRKTVLCNGSSLPPKNAATISAEISDGKKAKTAQAAERLSAAAKCNTAGEKAEARTKKSGSEKRRRNRQKTPQAEKPCGSTAGKQGRRNAIPHTYNI